MADNVLINAVTAPGGQTIATDDIGGIQHELVKIEFGSDGVATMVDAANPLPVSVIGGIIVGSEVEIKNDAGSPVPVSVLGPLRNNRLDAADTFTSGETLPDQSGSGAVLTFTFAAVVDLVWVKSDVLDSRADPFGGTPSATQGIPCEAGIPQPITLRTSVVKVFAPLTATVKVWGYSYL